MVRVGGFSDRYEAEDYMQLAKAAGYTNAWVVVVNLVAGGDEPLYDSSVPVEEEAPGDVIGSDDDD